MSKIRRIRCYSCKTLVAPNILAANGDTYQPFAVIPLRIPNKVVGCICSECVENYSLSIGATIETMAGKFEDFPADEKSNKEEKEEKLEKKKESPKEPQEAPASATSAPITPTPTKKSPEELAAEAAKLEEELLEDLRKQYSCLEYSLDSLAAYVAKTVFGQKKAIEDVLYALYFNQMSNFLEELGQMPYKHKHVLLIGGTGVGKTLLATTAAKAFGVTYSISNTTPITSAGYIGDKVENVLERLLDEAGGNLLKAQNGVIILDEFDKKRSAFSDNGKDVTGKAVQQELLKLLEPSKVWIKNNTVQFYTGNLTIILMGAFVGLDEIIEARTKTHYFGFGTREEVDKKNTDKSVTPDDLIEYGFIPEIVGRIPIISQLNSLTRTVIIDIIYKHLERYNSLFELKSFELHFSPVLIEKIADEIMESKTGARDVEVKIDEILRPALYRAFQSKPNGICEIDSNGSINMAYPNKKHPTKVDTLETPPIKKYLARQENYD